MGSVMGLFMKQKEIPRGVSKGINQFVHVRVIYAISILYIKRRSRSHAQSDKGRSHINMHIFSCLSIS
jgi:hypothetical protein